MLELICRVPVMWLRCSLCSCVGVFGRPHAAARFVNGLYRWSRVQGTLLGASGFFSVFGMGLTTQHRATGYYDKATARQQHSRATKLAQQSFFSFVQRTEAAALFGLRCNTHPGSL